ncbi:hypothetical protein C8R48DRAFT_778113 [Suillus tomentosus]|nr:hypothetical protein C8R48DRAFT_778113 [Suillus tomentosus]
MCLLTESHIINTSANGELPSSFRISLLMEFKSQTPVVNDVRDITISKRGGNVLISFERKTPPQLWKMELVRDAKGREQHSFAQVARLLLRHTYLPKAQVDIAGSSYFGDKEDQLVLCAGKAGDIHIWDRDSAALLHYIRP